MAGLGLLALWALSPRVTWLGRPLLSLDGLYALGGALTHAFRATGRFIWALHYLVLASAIALLALRWRGRPWVAACLLGAAVALQGADLWQVLRYPRFRPASGFLAARPALEGTGARHVVLVPPLILDGSTHLCDRMPDAMKVVAPLARAAYRNGMTINSGYVTRLDAAATKRYCRRLFAELRASGPRSDTIYFVARNHVSLLERRGATCERDPAGAVWRCTTGRRDSP